MSRPMPDDAVYHGTVGRITKALDPHTEADPIGVHMSLMSALSIAVGTEARVKVGNQKHPLSVWSILVGETSSGRKGTATGEALNVFEIAFPNFMDSTTHFMEVNISSGAALVKEMYSRATEAEWGNVLKDDNQDYFVLKESFPALLVSEEWATVLKRSRIDDSLGQNLRVAWQGNTLSSVTKKDSFILPKPHLGVIGHITPGELASSLSASDLAGGSANRFLWMYTQRSKSLPLGGDMSEEELESLASDYRSIVEYAKTVKGVIGLSDAAKKLWVDSMYEEINVLVSVSGKMEAFAGRALPYVMRLAALYALSEHRNRIEPDDLRAGEAAVRYMMESVEYSILSYESESADTEQKIPVESTGAKIADDVPGKLRDLIIREGGEIPTRQAYQRLNLKADQADEAASRLGRDVVKVRIPTSSRPRLVYRWVGKEVPTAPTGAVAAAERPQGRVHVVEKISNPEPVTREEPSVKPQAKGKRKPQGNGGLSGFLPI